MANRFEICNTTWLHDKIVSFCYSTKREKKIQNPFLFQCPRFILRTLRVYLWSTNVFYSWFFLTI